MAVGALRAARDLQAAVPGKLSIIGVDDIPLAAHLDPPRTTVHQDFSLFGREAARLLIRAMGQPDHAPPASAVAAAVAGAAFDPRPARCGVAPAPRFE